VRHIRRIALRLVDVLGSYGLACVLFLLLMVLTLFGTLEQANHSLEDVRQKYFDSVFFMSDYLPVPLPGAYLLLAILSANLFVGGLLRMRRTWSRAGIFVIHIGIAVLLLSGLVEHHTSKKGYMTLFEGQSASHFESHYDWDLSLIEQLADGRERVYTIPHDRLPATGEVARYRAAGLPFTLELRGFLRNCQPRPSSHAGSDSVDAFVLAELPLEPEAERNIPGLTVRIDGAHGTRLEGLVWGLQQAPYVARVDGRRWAIDLHKRRWPLPFTVSLRRFTRELHPRTGIASSFASDVTRTEGNVAQDVHISMNDPMREGGFTFYQSGWGPENAPEGSRLFSTFSVVENPADRGPLVACVIIAVGLVWHFARKLRLHLRTEAGRAS
jgi:hypothetical protein